MTPYYALIEIIFGAAVAFGFGFYQLWSVNREIAADKARKAAETANSPHAASDRAA